MNISQDGARPRYYHERAKVEDQVGSPLHGDVTLEARARLVREIASMNYYETNRGRMRSTRDEICREAEKVLGGSFDQAEPRALKMNTGGFLTYLEIAANVIWRARRSEEDLNALQSVLADDLSAFRIRNVGANVDPQLQVQPIDNQHLHAEIVDRTFELTRTSSFESAQQDYREAWKHYAKGDLDDAVVNAHKSVESAMKIVVKRVDPTKMPENLQTSQLVPLLVQLDVLPSRLQNLVSGLNQIFLNSGSLRNSAGMGHGSIDLKSPEATVALLALRMSGTLVCFLVDRYEQIKRRAEEAAQPPKP